MVTATRRSGLVGVLLALDVGERRVGVAVSDALGILASPVKTLTRTTTAALLEDIAELVREYRAEKVVVGLPKTLRNTHSRQTQKVTSFADNLMKALDVPVVLWDERLTTAEATRILRGPDDGRRKGTSAKRRKRVKDNVDQVAATLVLESYMAAQRSGAASPSLGDA
jgi:putative Holliday junction resolvase